MAIQTEIVTITADKARDLLARNTSNRKVSKTNLNVVVAALRRGEWKVNGEAIKVAEDGTILDGQHRLIACMETGIAIRTLVVTGLPADTQQTMDTGKARSPKDVLALRGHSNSGNLAAATLAIIRSEQYSIRAAAKGDASYPVTTAQIVARAEDEPGIAEVARYGKKFGFVGLPARIASMLYYRFTEIDPDDAQAFFDSLYSGESLGAGHPILALRTQLIKSKASVKGERSPIWMAAIAIKAWNKYRAGESATLLRFVPGGASPEPFPEPR